MISNKYILLKFLLVLDIIQLVACNGLQLIQPINNIKNKYDTSPTPETTALSIGEIYLIQSTQATPFRYRLTSLPSQCLLMDIACPKPKIVSQFPASEFIPASLNWSPDGSLALFTNNYDSQVLMLDPIKLRVERVSIESSVMSDQIVWSPDSQWAALEIQISDPYASDILLVNPKKGVVKNLSIDLEGMKQPLGWLDQDNLLILQKKYDNAYGSSKQKLDIVEENIYVVNIHDLQSKILIPDLVLLGGMLPMLSPDRRLIALSTIRKERIFLDLYTVNGRKIHTYNNYMQPVWSEESRRLAVTYGTEENGYSILLLNTEGNEEQQLVTLKSLPYYVWSPDDLHLFIITRWDEGENEFTSLQIMSTFGNTHIIPNLNGIVEEGYNLIGLSFRPAPSSDN
ncbi:MAG: hypothetical protein ACPL4H_01935 [Anaerolineales bacterium]